MWPKHGDKRGGERYDRPSMAWVPAAEWQRRQWDREDRIFAKQANQGQLCSPQIVRDGQGGIRGLQSMVDGKMYDSKSEMRKHYKRDGVIEVGGDSSLQRGPKRWRDPNQDKKIDAALGKAFNRVGLPPL